MDTPKCTIYRYPFSTCYGCSEKLYFDAGCAKLTNLHDGVTCDFCVSCLEMLVDDGFVHSECVPADQATLYLIHDIRKKKVPWSEDLAKNRRKRQGKIPGNRDLLESQGRLCAICLDFMPGKTAVLDHIMPIRLGGTTSYCNLQMVCRSCNQRKKDWHPLDFACLLRIEGDSGLG